MNPQVWTRTASTAGQWHLTAARLIRAMGDNPVSDALRQAMRRHSSTHSELEANHECLAYICRAAELATGANREAIRLLSRDLTGEVLYQEGMFLEPAFWLRDYATVVAHVARLELYRKGNDPVSAKELWRAKITQEQREACSMKRPL